MDGLGPPKAGVSRPLDVVYGPLAVIKTAAWAVPSQQTRHIGQMGQ